MGYSLDFRKRVLEIKEKEGLSNRETSERFGISMRSLFRWQNRIEPKLKREKPATKIGMQTLELDVEKHPDAYLEERAGKLNLYERREITISFYFLFHKEGIFG